MAANTPWTIILHTDSRRCFARRSYPGEPPLTLVDPLNLEGQPVEGRFLLVELSPATRVARYERVTFFHYFAGEGSPKADEDLSGDVVDVIAEYGEATA